jgi:pyruvate, water dikinase
MKTFRFWMDQLFSTRQQVSRKYEAYMDLLAADQQAHRHMAVLEEIYYQERRVDFSTVETTYDDLSRAVGRMVTDINRICPSCYGNLNTYFKKLDGYVRYMLSEEIPSSPPYVLPLGDLDRGHGAVAGAKAVNLARIRRHLNLPVPDGFAITSHALQALIAHNHLRPEIDAILAEIDIDNPEALEKASGRLTLKITTASLPAAVEDEVLAALARLQSSAPAGLTLAVRSSALGEDGTLSFAGQFHSLLDVAPDDLLAAYRSVLAGKYRPRAIAYRVRTGMTDRETPMAVLVLSMVIPETSGVLYTRNPGNTGNNTMMLQATTGSGDKLVSGRVSPERLVLTREPEPAVLERQAGDVEDPILPDRSARTLGGWGMAIEVLFKKPQDIEWCVSALGKPVILQSRPIQGESLTEENKADCRFEQIEEQLLISTGESASAGIGAGPVFPADDTENLVAVPHGSVLVARDASPRLSRVLDRVAAIVTERGNATSHFASIAREAGIPLLVDVGAAITELVPGRLVTVHADEKKVYAGQVQQLIDSPCARRMPAADTPYMRRLGFVIRFVSPLGLTDPGANAFTPEGCRSLHDVIRFTHEMAVQEMFRTSDRRLRKIQGARRMDAGIPMRFFLVDAGGGLTENNEQNDPLTPKNIASVPMQALIRGLTHPDIEWGDFSHFDWAEYDKIVMSGGIVSADADMFASHVIVAADYVNVNLRFGYHFVVLDALCGNAADENHVQLRFTGGGAELSQRVLRVKVIGNVLKKLTFSVERRSDLLEANIKGLEREALLEKLDWTGRLLGATRLMDMYIKRDDQIEDWVGQFMAGRYHFASV